eukprot:scaffold16916_cov49-Phaeocystis_antarctica.AAC.6
MPARRRHPRRRGPCRQLSAAAATGESKTCREDIEDRRSWFCSAASLHGTDGRRRGKVPGNLGFYNVPASSRLLILAAPKAPAGPGQCAEGARRAGAVRRRRPPGQCAEGARRV